MAYAYVHIFGVLYKIHVFDFILRTQINIISIFHDQHQYS